MCRAAELDDVLLQAMWRRPRGCLRELMQNARTKAAVGGYKKSVAAVREQYTALQCALTIVVS